MTKTFQSDLIALTAKGDGTSWTVETDAGNPVAYLPAEPPLAILAALADAYLSGKRIGIESGRRTTVAMIQDHLKKLE